jgi:hypothetical protein
MMRALLWAPPQAAQVGHPGQPCETLSVSRASKKALRIPDYVIAPASTKSSGGCFRSCADRR